MWSDDAASPASVPLPCLCDLETAELIGGGLCRDAVEAVVGVAAARWITRQGSGQQTAGQACLDLSVENAYQVVIRT